MGKGQKGQRETRRRAAREAAVAPRPLWRRFLPTIVVIVAIGAIVGANLLRGSAPADGDGAPVDGGSPSAIDLVTSLPDTVYDGAGVSGLVNIDAVRLLPDEEPLTADGKLLITYIGAEYCPYCAAERWAMVIALSRFGTWTGLEPATSGPPPEVYPDTATFTFANATYESPTVAFSSVELADREGNPLQTMTPEQQRLFDTYNTDFYMGQGGGVPFIMIGGKFGWVGSRFDVGLLQNLTFDQIAQRLADPNDQVTKAVVGAANVITGAICRLAPDPDPFVCVSDGALSGRATLPPRE